MEIKGKKMKKIITAIGDKKLNEELKKYENIEILTLDIPYKEGILEVLENEKNIDILIFNEEIDGQIEFEDLIDTIKLINKNIEIIVILRENNLEKIKYLNNKKINKIFLKENFNFNNIINLIFEENKIQKNNINNINNINNLENNFYENKKNNLNYNLKKIEEKNINNNIKNIEENYLNNLYEKNKYKINKNKLKIKNKKENKIQKIINKIKNIFKRKKITKKIIAITGIGGVGKSIFTVQLANAFCNEKNKILIIDFDLLNSCIHTLFGVNKYPKNIKENLDNYEFIKNLCEEKNNIKKLIIKINNKINLISGIDLLLKNKNEIYEIIQNLNNEYNIILIDTETDNNEYNNLIMKFSDEIIFLIEANLIQIKKSINLLNNYTNNFNIENKKINIINNKKANDSVDEIILKNIFSEYNFLGNIFFNKNYNKLINKNMNKKYINKKIKKEYKKISKKILK